MDCTVVNDNGLGGGGETDILGSDVFERNNFKSLLSLSLSPSSPEQRILCNIVY